MSGAACEIASAVSDGYVVVSDDARLRQVFAAEARGAEPRGCFDLLAASSSSESLSKLTRHIMADGGGGGGGAPPQRGGLRPRVRSAERNGRPPPRPSPNNQEPNRT